MSLVSVAPMMQWTDRHCRYLLRLLSLHTLLYTEMVTTGAILHGKRLDLLQFHPDEHPLVLQLGGSDPQSLAECARIAEGLGYDAVNLNVGCPSDRVQSGRFGACLFKEPALVADCVQAMCATVAIPITVKTRIGVDDLDTYEALQQFITQVANAGCDTFILHARKAWLKGLSPKQNRDIPPLRYDTVYRVKQDNPELQIIINGGVQTLEEIAQHLLTVDGVMLGRSAYYNPMLLATVDSQIYQQSVSTASANISQPAYATHTPYSLVEAYLPYMEHELAKGTFLAAMARHLLPLFQGLPGARAWRRHLTENMHRDGAGVEVVEEGLARLQFL